MFAVAILIGVFFPIAQPAKPPEGVWWDGAVAASLDRVPAKKAAWEKALTETPVAQRKGMAYLIAYLPLRDLEGLAPEVLVKNRELAYRVRGQVAWGAKLPEEVFLDAVLPHGCLTEPRDSMRAEFMDKYLSLVKDCTTPGAAGCKINEHLFKDYKVTYNTRRLRTDQCSRESIAQGMATCTGLSLMLVEACRAVGVPARVATIASWPGRGGNHTWVEVWDTGWHFVGAAEPDPAGLDRGWFAGDASKALKDTPKSAIWASTYKPTGQNTPLAWNAKALVPGENVTDRYTANKAVAPAQPRLMVEVRRKGERVVADVLAVDGATGKLVLSGQSFGPRADINHHLSAQVADASPVFVLALSEGKAVCCSAKVIKDTVLVVDLDKPDDNNLTQLLKVRFGTDAAAAAEVGKLLAKLPWDPSMRELAWKAYKESPRHQPLKKELAEKSVSTPERTSPYLWRKVGEKPKEGWSLVIAMHGGGGTTKAINDGQWKGMFERYYRNHPEAGGYIYLALRAPNDTWNGFYDDAICPLIERLILQFVLFEEVNPDRVYTLGASHGGYGAFVIGPKIPDRFGAVHASASAPTDGETQGENLRNVRFTFMVGEKDTAYGRAERCQKFAKLVEEWRKKSGGYPGEFEWRPGVGHSVPDRDKVAEMLKYTRDPHPAELVWVQSDSVLKNFYWVEADKPVDKGRIEASLKDNKVTLRAEGQGPIALWLDAPLVDFTKPLKLVLPEGKTKEIKLEPNLEWFCQSLEKRADPQLAAPVRVEIPQN